MIIVDDFPQMSPEWFQAKVGIPSAGSFDKIVGVKGKPSEQKDKYLYRLAGESITGTRAETYASEAMRRGVEFEAEARQAYEFINDVEARQVGLCYEDSKKYLASPDGLMESIREGLEIKCPLMHTHVEYLLNPKKLRSDYFQQCQGNLLVTGYDVWNLFSYYPGLKPCHLQIERDEEFLKKLSEELDKFCLDLICTVNKLKNL